MQRVATIKSVIETTFSTRRALVYRASRYFVTRIDSLDEMGIRHKRLYFLSSGAIGAKDKGNSDPCYITPLGFQLLSLVRCGQGWNDHVSVSPHHLYGG